MTKQCNVVHCGEPSAGYSTLCESHKRNLRRHGHAQQKGITVGELKTFTNLISARRAKNPNNPAWELLRARWETLTAHLNEKLNAYANGSIAISYERQTAEQIGILQATVPAETVIETALAMFLLQEQRPNRFMSDKAFNFQLARRVRGLAEGNTATNYNVKEGRIKRTYKDVAPRVLACLAEALTAVFGVAGMSLAALEKKDAESIKAERHQLHDALKEMK